MQVFRLTLLGMVSVLTACSSGFNRSDMQKQTAFGPSLNLEAQDSIEVRDQPSHVTAADIRDAYARQPQAQPPFRLAIRLVSNRYPKTLRWEDADKKRFEEWIATLKARGVVSDAFFIPDIATNSDDLPQLRLAAAKLGADTLLVVKAAADTDRYLNPSAILYLTLVGYYFIPGSHADALVMLTGAVFDVKNEYIYATADAEGEEHSWGPGAFVSSEESVRKAQTKAFEAFGNELTERMTRIR